MNVKKSLTHSKINVVMIRREDEWKTAAMARGQKKNCVYIEWGESEEIMWNEEFFVVGEGILWKNSQGFYIY